MSMERDALMREVDEELRREQFKKLWEQYGTYIVGAALALLIGVAAYKWNESRRTAAADRAGQQFEEALNLVAGGQDADARKILQTISSGSGAAYPVLAQLALAGQAVKAGNNSEAITAYEQAASKASDPLIADFARLQSTALKIDSADFTEVKNRLNDLIQDKNPWRYLARELMGVAAIRGGQLDEARSLLAPMSADPRAPAAVRERAGAMMNVVVAAELERSAPGKVELEKTDPPAGASEVPAKSPPQPPRNVAPSKGGAPKGK